MANRLILWVRSIPGWVDPQQSKYRFLTGEPQKVGDEALIKVGHRRVRVMLHESFDSEGGRYLWLVEQRAGGA